MVSLQLLVRVWCLRARARAVCTAGHGTFGRQRKGDTRLAQEAQARPSGCDERRGTSAFGRCSTVFRVT
ncbi:hypothetical protein PF011_g17419 [Phytophthora fragariae]|uniref:Secreted protein n=1 Tax=Phytophthora fragariae TaxID=53985 RepID=A0A6A3JK39_9STRA|nr:hypothetical protein PF011_g17419 [Phytophthora fragariae]